jgi:hypothetical protein
MQPWAFLLFFLVYGIPLEASFLEKCLSLAKGTGGAHIEGTGSSQIEGTT